MTDATTNIPSSDARVDVLYGGEVIAVVRSLNTLKGILPFDISRCVLRTAVASDGPHALALTPHTWQIGLKCIVSLNAASRRHWLFLSAPSDAGLKDVSMAFTLADVSTLSERVMDLLSETVSAGPMAYRLFIVSEHTGIAKAADSVGNNVGEPPVCVNERVLLANHTVEIASMICDCLYEFFLEDRVDPTVVVWPSCLPFPVNVHAYSDALRKKEHEDLLLPYKAFLHTTQRVQDWVTAADLALSHGEVCKVDGTSRGRPRLICEPHLALKKLPTLSTDRASTHLVKGAYDYYHYYVDGFKDDGWGCAYRSLQTILSWLRYAGFMTEPIPSLRDIQRILAVVDPEKMGKPNFVGSREWIGSFEIMLVLQHFIQGLECIIKRVESGAALDTDPSLQMLLLQHFQHERASPVMIGGGNYAQTILGVHMDVNTMEAEYLILDPHYSANPTNLQTAINKGYVGWKQASKFFQAECWYNLCIPRTDLYDPR